ncbi:MAG: hypothetical protein ACM3ML_19595 [Micromonosporaceae bacterium]
MRPVLADPAGSRVGGTLGRTSASPVPGSLRHAQAEDDLLAFLLIHTWTLTTGRVLRSDVPPSQLSEEELIAFWADDHIPHTAEDGVSLVAGA